jgi:5-methylcytosine-specific restriction endonuclease McrA
VSEAKPYPKVVQLASHRKKYRRKVVSRASWERLRDEKGSACRICGQTNPAVLHLHHLVHRDDRGDDVADNLAPLCGDCHRGVHLREPAHCRLLLSRLSDAEYAYMVTHGGEDYAERVYGIEYRR